MMRQSLAEGKRRIVLQAPTGYGKTLTAAKIILMALAKGKRVLFTVPLLSLVDQTVSEFLKEGIPHIGVIQSNHPRTDATAPVQVASVQTLARRPLAEVFDLVLVDECHITFDVIYRLMDQWPASHFVGLSATPWARGMGLRWQGLVQSITIGELIEQGYLSRFLAYAPDVPDLSGVKTVAGDYAEDDAARVMEGKALMASIVETWLAKGENRPTLLFGVNRAHARNLQQEFIRAGVSAGYCDAKVDSVERALLGRQFKSGEVKIACSVRTLTTGIDWPVSCIIDAAPTQSEMLHVQKIGRGLRVNPGTEDLIILDHAGNSLRLGLVTDIHHDKLDATPKGEKQQRGQKAEKLPKECGNCAALVAANPCPFCGHERKPVAGVDHVDGQLIEISGKAPVYTREQKQAWWSAIQAIKLDRRKSDGWASHCYRDKFGVWPRGLDDRPGPVSQDVRNWVKAKAIRWAKSQEARRVA
jgi:superfamily II DNA or RNA helicase